MPSSKDFNGICYLRRYPDLRTDTNTGIENRNGYMVKRDGRWQYGKPNLVEQATGNYKKISDDPFWHWQNFGQYENRVPGCDFMPGTVYENVFYSEPYLARYPDVRSSKEFANNPEKHYREFGIYEGRVPGYEVIPNLNVFGLLIPGTFKVSDQIEQPVKPGDEGFTPELPASSTAPDDGTGVSDSNQLYYIVGGGLILLYLLKNKKNGKKKSRRNKK